MKELNYQFRQELAEVHKRNRRDPDKALPKGFVEIDSSWTITIPDDCDIVIKNAALDLQDYFLTSMNMCLRLAFSGDVNSKIICFEIDETLPEYSYRLSVSEEKVVFCGHNSRFSAQAGYFAEDLMNLEEAPFLEIQNTTRTSLFNPRMIHSGYGLDMYPDEHIRAIAHAGISSVLVFVKGVDETPFGYQDFNDLIYRASKYGVDVYAYSYLRSRFHPEDDGALEYYESTYGALFKRCPSFKGIILVGESVDFPSKDERTTGLPLFMSERGPGGEIIWGEKPYPGYFPSRDFPQWLEMVKGVIRKRKPDADIVFWTYNWGKDEERIRLELIDNLPTDISLMATYEMFQDVEIEGVMNRTTDYTLFFEGPGDYFNSEAKRAGERGIPMYSQANTGGLTWDMGVIPYIPAPYQWIRRYEGMIKSHYENGLCGVMDSHHYGFYPSFISDLAKWAFHTPKADLNEVLHKLAARDFTKERADDVCHAYELFSEGIRNNISTNPDQYGPSRVGPSFPLILFDNADFVFKSPKHAHFGGNKICFPNYDIYPKLTTDALKKTFEFEIKSYKKEAELFDEGARILESILPELPDRKKHNAEKIVNLAKFMSNVAKTVVAVKEWKKRKDILLDTHGQERNKLVSELIDIAKEELLNAKNTIPLVEFDSRLGYEPSMEYMCDREHLEIKIALCEDVIANELPKYFE